MEDEIEIDLRRIIKDLLKSWKWIAGITLVIGAAAIGFSLLQPRIYSASALIAITKPRYLPNFDDQYQTVNNNPPTSAAIISLATSDEVVQELYDSWDSIDKETTTPREFRDNNLNATNSRDASIVELKVIDTSSAEAARLANAWAAEVSTRSNRLFSGTDVNQVENFENQIAAVEQNLQAAEQTLAEFESRNTIAVLDNQLASLLAQQSDWLRKQRLIEASISDVNGLTAQLTSQLDTAIVSGSLQTNFLVLQLRIYNDSNAASIASAPAASSSESTSTSQASPQVIAPSLQVQIPNQSNTPITLPDQSIQQGMTKQAFLAQAQAWIDSLQGQSQEISSAIAALDSQITTLQQQKQQQVNEKERLALNYHNSQNIYSILLNKLTEVKNSTDELYGNTHVASEASEPVRPDPRNAIRNTAIGLAAGLIVSIAFVLLKNWWKNNT